MWTPLAAQRKINCLEISTGHRDRSAKGTEKRDTEGVEGGKASSADLSVWGAS